MTPEEQRIAIAEACGWEIAHKVGKPGSMMCGCTANDSTPRQIPNYLHDLNAMHEAEKLLTEWQDREYRNTLIEVTAYQEHRATAAQRAKAFLRAIGKRQD